MRAAALVAVLLATSSYAGPAEAVTSAAKDARSVPVATSYRYLTTDGMRPKEVESFYKALTFHVNSLSREADLVAPLAVGAGLYRVNLVDYQWDARTWEKLADVEPYFHVTLAAETVEYEEYGHWYINGQAVAGKQPGATWKTEERRPVKKQSNRTRAAAPWLPAVDIAYLIERTQSQCPIVRADWFLTQTARQQGAPGYYDFLGLGNKESDFLDLIGADKGKARKLKKEIAGLMMKSGVAINNRVVIRMQSITGPYWFTLDFNTSIDKQNVIRLLDGDHEPPDGDVSEEYGALPNELPATFLRDKDGVRQDTVPDKIAHDITAGGNDLRIHAQKSCTVCHVEVIRPVNDYARKLYKGAVQLQSPDYAKFVRLRQLYLSDLEGRVKQDQGFFAAAIFRCNGLTPAQNAAEFAKAFDGYLERDVTIEDAARHWGMNTDAFSQALKVYSKATGSLDPVLAAYIQTPPLDVRREMFEEVQPLLWAAIKGVRLTP
jgi:hypothetical protein